MSSLTRQWGKQWTNYNVIVKTANKTGQSRWVATQLTLIVVNYLLYVHVCML